MRLLSFLSVLAVAFFSLATNQASKKSSSQTSPLVAIETPKENQEKGDKSNISSFEDRARKLLRAIVDNKPESVSTLFFPAPAFAKLKDLKGHMAYYEKLKNWFADDITREHHKIRSLKTPVFDSFKLGYCKWKEIGAEYNKIPYWSCWKSILNVIDETKKRHTITIRVLINWGKEWYVTHLGPIPK